MAFNAVCFKHTVLSADGVKIVVVCPAFFVVHLHNAQLLLCLAQTGSLGVVLYVVVLEEVKPFLDRSFRYFVKLVNPNKVVFGEKL